MEQGNKIRIIDIVLLIYIVTVFLYTDDNSTIYKSNLAFIIYVLSVLIWIFKYKHGKFSIANLKIYFPILIFSVITIPIAVRASLAIEKACTLAILMILVAVISNCFLKDGEPNFILFCLMIAGFVVSINIIREYGYSNILLGLMSGNRIGEEVLQLNYLGRYAYTCAITAFYFAYYKNKKLMYLVFGVGLFICLASQSRQSLIALVVTTIILYLIKDFSNKKLFIIFRILIVIAIVYVIIRLPVLEAFRTRLLSGLLTIDEKNYAGSESDEKRVYMIQFGIEIFKKYPMFGIGLGNIRTVVSGIISEYKYLHNNYVELLACGGIIGFISYYSIYLSAFKKIKCYLNYVIEYNDELIISIVLLIGQLVLDMFAVTYYSKIQYIIFSFVFVIISRAKDIKEPH
jgi:O-antigen ligase